MEDGDESHETVYNMGRVAFIDDKAPCPCFPVIVLADGYFDSSRTLLTDSVDDKFYSLLFQ